jgi:hypothetical protein
VGVDIDGYTFTALDGIKIASTPSKILKMKSKLSMSPLYNTDIYATLQLWTT